jgi:hypothetical protein
LRRGGPDTIWPASMACVSSSGCEVSVVVHDQRPGWADDLNALPNVAEGTKLCTG